MEQVTRSRKSNSSYRRQLVVGSLLLCFLAMGIIISVFYYLQLDEKPSKEQITMFPAKEKVEQLEKEAYFYPVIQQGNLLTDKVIITDGEMYLPFSLFQKQVDANIFWDEASKAVIFTKLNDVVTLRSNLLTSELKNEEVPLSFPIIQLGEEVYIPFSPFSAWYPINLVFHSEKEMVELQNTREPKLAGKIISENPEKVEEIYLRSAASNKSPYYEQIAPQEDVQVLSEDAGWYYIQSEAGAIGYVEKRHVQLKGVQTSKEEQREEAEETFVAWKPLGDKINLTWEHVVSKTPNPETITPPKGVNVLSPTWFHLENEQGKLRNLADKTYADWAHQQGFQLWALVTNDFNPDRTHAFLSNYEYRKQMIKQLIYYTEIYQLDGINLDFENVYLKDKDSLVQFVRELTPYMHELGLVVSIDVTIKSSSEMWSMFLDRQALGEVVDYMMVMTYDEHWGSSPVAGSVASLPWVEKGLKGVLAEVPAHKLLLGVPFYTRIWKEEVDEQGQVKVTSRAFSMPAVEKWMAERQLVPVYDEQAKQYYVEYEDQQEKAHYKIWLEDEHSIAERTKLVHKYNLAGIASWRRGFEKEEIWNVIADGLKARSY